VERSKLEGRVEELSAKFKGLREAFMSEAIVKVGLSVLRVADDLAQVKDKLDDHSALIPI
jgi:hypothetical protein